jgi:hypothetical protein
MAFCPVPGHRDRNVLRLAEFELGKKHHPCDLSGSVRSIPAPYIQPENPSGSIFKRMGANGSLVSIGTGSGLGIANSAQHF